MATVNAQSVEDFADRIVYRFPGGVYDQALSAWNSVFNEGLKTLVNTDVSRSYIIPASGLSYRFFKVELSIFGYARVTESGGGYGLMVLSCKFSRVSIPSLNYDGKSLLTDFYSEKSENIVVSQQLRAINIGNVLMEPAVVVSDLQFTGLSHLQFSNGAGTSGLRAIVQPTVTAYKK